MQDARYSIGWFVWPKDNVLIQGPAKKYPPTTMKEFMKVRGKYQPSMTVNALPKDCIWRTVRSPEKMPTGGKHVCHSSGLMYDEKAHLNASAI